MLFLLGLRCSSFRLSRASCRTFFFFFNDTATTEIYTLSLHDALPIFAGEWKHEYGSTYRCIKRWSVDIRNGLRNHGCVWRGCRCRGSCPRRRRRSLGRICLAGSAHCLAGSAQCEQSIIDDLRSEGYAISGKPLLDDHLLQMPCPPPMRWTCSVNNLLCPDIAGQYTSVRNPFLRPV